jgi:lipopolysaccharide/colanic/teichoic acid biosynthesis glycosyltransferase
MNKNSFEKRSIFDEKLINDLKKKKRTYPFYTGNYYPFFKRVADIGVSTLALIVLIILFPFVVIAIKIDSKGPLFFIQERIGLYGEVIKIYKLRTMCVDAENMVNEETFNQEGNPFVQIQDDKRVTRVGKILRRFSIDELPQLFCVFKGDMSFIGPRPFIEKEIEMLTRDHQFRHMIKPGLTGLAQVSGRGELNQEQRFEKDMEYLEKLSAWLDIKILWLTIISVIFSKGV